MRRCSSSGRRTCSLTDLEPGENQSSRPVQTCCRSFPTCPQPRTRILPEGALLPRFMVELRSVRESVMRTSSASFFRRTPLLTKMAWNLSPIASFIRTAATVESTPPETAPMTVPSPTTLLICSFAYTHLHDPSSAVSTVQTEKRKETDGGRANMGEKVIGHCPF